MLAPHRGVLFARPGEEVSCGASVGGVVAVGGLCRHGVCVPPAAGLAQDPPLPRCVYVARWRIVGDSGPVGALARHANRQPRAISGESLEDGKGLKGIEIIEFVKFMYAAAHLICVAKSPLAPRWRIRQQIRQQTTEVANISRSQGVTGAC